MQPPDLEDAVMEEVTENVAGTLQSTYATLNKNRRASLASIVEGVPTAPPTATAAHLAFHEHAEPTITARPGTNYGGGLPVNLWNGMTTNAAAGNRASRRTMRASTAGSLASAEGMRSGSPLSRASSLPRSSATPQGALNDGRLTSSPATGRPSSTSATSRSMGISPVGRLVASTAGTMPGARPESPPAAERELFLIERQVGSTQVSSHGKGRQITTGVLPSTFVPPKRARYNEWLTSQVGGSASASSAGTEPTAGVSTLTAFGSKAGEEGGAPAPATPVLVASATSASAGEAAAPAAPTAARSPRVASMSEADVDAAVATLYTSRATVASGVGGETARGSPLHATATGTTSPAPGAAGTPGRKPRYPKTMYSGFKLSTISNYSGVGSGSVYATYAET
ncbi:hypothetical protein EON62_02640, partial [archaeon]